MCSHRLAGAGLGGVAATGTPAALAPSAISLASTGQAVKQGRRDYNALLSRDYNSCVNAAKSANIMPAHYPTDPTPLQAGLTSEDVLAAKSTRVVLCHLESSVFAQPKSWALFWGQRVRARMHAVARAITGAHAGALYALRDLISGEPAGSSKRLA
jgi:hypothetical protein